MKVKGLRIYPVKSLAGSSLQEAELEARGFKDDRRWMLIDKNGRFISQREYHFLALWQVKVKGDILEFENIKTGASFVVKNARATKGALVEVQVWDSNFQARLVEMDDDASFQETLGMEARLVYMAEDSSRNVDLKYATKGEEVSFADGYPYLITNTASLGELSDRLGEKLEMLRFRPNIIVETDTPFLEDNWKQISIGQQQFRIPKPCARCVVITIDPQTIEKNKKVMSTLATFRKVGNKVLFGVNGIWERKSEAAAFIRLGDEINIQ